MKEFKNLKIEVNAEQPLDEIVKELERLGYKTTRKQWGLINIVETYSDGVYCFYNEDWHVCRFTTLSELKEM